MTGMYDIDSLCACIQFCFVFVFFVLFCYFYHISTPGREKAEVLYVCSLLIPLQGWVFPVTTKTSTWNSSGFCWKGIAHSKGWGKKSMNGHIVFINIWSFDRL